jgi:hypothetical protein
LHWATGQGAQLPALQTSVGPQASPQVPQLPWSVSRVTQAWATSPPSTATEHKLCPVQATWHWPRLQATVPPVGAAQTMPQPPQLFTSVMGLTQAVPQAICPVAQATGSDPVVVQAADRQAIARATATRWNRFMGG